MDKKRFDLITKAWASTPSRRHLLRRVVGGMIFGIGLLDRSLPYRGAGIAVAGTRGVGEPCRRKRQCQRGLQCQNKVCCAVAGDICGGDQECCSGACDPETELCLCSTTLEPVCGDRCCNPLTQACQDNRCCKLEGVACRGDAECCGGDCHNGRCGSLGQECVFHGDCPQYPNERCCEGGCASCPDAGQCLGDICGCSGYWCPPSALYPRGDCVNNVPADSVACCASDGGGGYCYQACSNCGNTPAKLWPEQ